MHRNVALRPPALRSALPTLISAWYFGKFHSHWGDPGVT